MRFSLRSLFVLPIAMCGICLAATIVAEAVADTLTAVLKVFLACG